MVKGSPMPLDESQKLRLRWVSGALMVGAALVPVLLSLVLARHLALGDQAGRASFYADDVLRRSEDTAAQAASAFARLGELPPDGGCSQVARDLLREIDVDSSYLQMVGFVEGDTLVCSSYGNQTEPVPLGPVQHRYPSGLLLRQDVELPFAPGRHFIVTSNGRFAAVVHKALPVDTTIRDHGVSVAVVTVQTPSIYATRGKFDPAWIPSSIAAGSKRTLRIGGYTVAQARAASLDIVAIASIGPDDYATTLERYAQLLVPVGLLFGMVFAWLVRRQARAQAGMAAGIRKALRDDQLFIVLQPIVSLASRRWMGAEVLLRWRHSDGRLVRPDLFIPVAEETGLIIEITARVFDKVEPVLAELHRRGSDVFLSVNLSPRDLLTDAALPRIRKLLERTGIPPVQLHVEVTERGFADTAAAREQVRRIRELGVRVSIDDFGTGYSSLSELVSFELDTLKIDKAFVDTIGSEAVTSQVAFHIVEMARSLKLETVAEGIEHEYQAQTLDQWGVDSGQGWLFAKPMSVDEFLERLAATS